MITASDDKKIKSLGHEEQQNHQNNYATQENGQPNRIRAIKAMCHHGIIESSSADGLV